MPFSRQRSAISLPTALAAATLPPALTAGVAVFAANRLAFIANAFAFVGFRLAELADFGCRLPDALLINPCNRDDRVASLRILGYRKGDAVARQDFDGVRIADEQLK